MTDTVELTDKILELAVEYYKKDVLVMEFESLVYEELRPAILDLIEQEVLRARIDELSKFEPTFDESYTLTPNNDVEGRIAELEAQQDKETK